MTDDRSTFDNDEYIDEERMDKALVLLQRDGFIIKKISRDGSIGYAKTQKQFHIFEWPGVDRHVCELAKDILEVLPPHMDEQELHRTLWRMERKGKIVSFERDGEIWYRLIE